MKRTINLSNTQFRYQLVFFIHIYGCMWLHIWLAEGCHLWWHPLPRQKMPSASFDWRHGTHFTTRHNNFPVKKMYHFAREYQRGDLFSFQDFSLGITFLF